MREMQRCNDKKFPDNSIGEVKQLVSVVVRLRNVLTRL